MLTGKYRGQVPADSRAAGSRLATYVEVYLEQSAAQVVEAAFEINGFEGQVREATAAIRAGRTQSAVVPLADTVQVLEWIDRIRAACGFPPLPRG